MITTLRHITAFLITLLISASTIVNAADNAPFVVVIDPGHGGKDSGCSGQLTNEKTIVLDVSKRFRDLISEKYPDVKTVMTRSDFSMR